MNRGGKVLEIYEIILLLVLLNTLLYTSTYIKMEKVDKDKNGSERYNETRPHLYSTENLKTGQNR